MKEATDGICRAGIMPWIRMRWRQVGDPNAVSAKSARGERVRRSLGRSKVVIQELGTDINARDD